MRPARSTCLTTLVAALGCGLLLSASAAAQEKGKTPAGDAEVGIHVVRPGESLEDITAYYLGSSGRWRENWALNPQIENPNLIYPGTRLNVLIPRSLPEDSARLVQVSRKVEDRRNPRDWEGAARNDLLKDDDGLKTFEGSSAEVLFADDTSLVLTEESLIFVGREEAPTRPVARPQVEIEYGQADLEGRRAGGGGEIVIVMGDAVATPRPKAAGKPVQARTRRPEGGGGAQVMVYSGESSLSAAGAQVEVDQGMGSTVAEGKPPSPPEKLLPAPVLVRPEAGSRWDVPDPVFAWEPVEGARAYILELCRDVRCALLERRLELPPEPRWQARTASERPADRRLAVGCLFWRVTARSASGLDGYPGAARDFCVVGDKIDRTAPESGVTFHGPQIWVGERRVLGPGAHIEGGAADDPGGSGLERWLPLLDGAETTLEGWRAPWTPGSHSASIRAVDLSGNVSTLPPEPFDYDPEPPVISWGLEDGAMLASTSGEKTDLSALEERQPSAFGAFWSRITGADQSPLLWTSSRLRWLPMTYDDWWIRSDKPYVVIRARKKPVTFPELGVTVDRDRGMWVHATDAGCGVERMSYQLLVGPGDEVVLVIEVTDALDNLTRVAWSLRSAP